MLKKHSDIPIPEDDPFHYDQLKRKDYVENITRLIQSTSEPFVLSINAQWGDGKTTFIKMLSQHLKNKGHPCIYFNAWETDFADDPLICFINEIDIYIDDVAFKGSQPKKRQIFKKIKGISKQLSILAAPLIIKFASQGLLDLETIKKFMELDEEGQKEIENLFSNFAQKKISDYSEQKRSVESFKTNLEELAKKLTSRRNKKAPLVLFVDELDRCRPSYAIKLLEDIKHLFSVSGIVFVLGIDRDQLSHMVKSLYGHDMDADGYLRRFIDIEFHLPEPERMAFCNFLFYEFDFYRTFDEKAKGRYDIENLKDTFYDLSNLFNFSLRKQGQCFTQLNLALAITPENSHLHPIYLAFLICFKFANSNLYYQYNRKDITVEYVLNYIKEQQNGETFLNTKIAWIIESYIREHILDEEGFNNFVRKLKEAAEGQSKSGPSDPLTREKHLYRLIYNRSQSIEYQYDIHTYLFNKIEMVEKFA